MPGPLDQIPLAAGLGGPGDVAAGPDSLRGGPDAAGQAHGHGQDPASARRKYEAAIEAFRLAQSRDTVSNLATRQAMYLTGLCLLDLGDRRAAWTQLDRTAKLFAGARGPGCGVREADLAGG